LAVGAVVVVVIAGGAWVGASISVKESSTSVSYKSKSTSASFWANTLNMKQLKITTANENNWKDFIFNLLFFFFCTVFKLIKLINKSKLFNNSIIIIFSIIIKIFRIYLIWLLKSKLVLFTDYFS